MKRRRYVDLSIAIEHDLPSDPDMMKPRIETMSHEVGAKEMAEKFFPGLDTRQLPMGIDAWSWDRPLPFMAKEFQRNRDPSIIWEAHFAGIEMGYCHLEKLANLSAIGRPHGFQVCCFPVKIKGASAGWVRAVAILEE